MLNSQKSANHGWFLPIGRGWASRSHANRVVYLLAKQLLSDLSDRNRAYIVTCPFS